MCAYRRSPVNIVRRSITSTTRMPMLLMTPLCVCVIVQASISGLYFTVPMALHKFHRRQFVLSKMRAPVKLLTNIKSLQAKAGHRP